MKYSETGRKYSQIPSVIGRPKKFETVDELEAAIEKYFRSCFVKVQRRELIRASDDEDSEKEYAWIDVVDEEGNPLYEQIRPLTVTGLAVALDTTRETLLDYENKPENAAFSDSIKRAKQRIHTYAEEYLFDGKNQTGAIFNLKNNWGWVDRTETDLTTKGKSLNVSAAVAAKADDILKEDSVADVITENSDDQQGKA
jgi:hypothetical protein